MKYFDWVPFFTELSERLLELCNAEDRINILRDKAIKIFGETHPVARFETIDPFSFIYAFAQRGGTHKFADICTLAKSELNVESSIPTDRVFPTPTTQTPAFFFDELSTYRFKNNTAVDATIIWDNFKSIFKADDNLPMAFEQMLSIKFVGVAKLTQCMFLIDPFKYLPLDNATKLPLSLPDDKEVLEKGWSSYKNYLDQINNIFPSCKYYEVNLFNYFLRKKNDQLILNRNYWQINTFIEGNDEKDFFSDFVKSNSIKVASAGTSARPFPLKVPKKGDIIFLRKGAKIVAGIGVVIENEYLGGFQPDKGIKILWIAKGVKGIDGELLDKEIFNRATMESVNRYALEYTNTFHLLEKLFPIPNHTEVNEPLEQTVITNIIGTENNNIRHSLNQILYGPPGTGKTFNSINYALSIIEGKSIEDLQAESVVNRKGVKERFDKLLVRDWENPKGRIGFITFHQSMSYEDFIEGIKPIPPAKEGENMTYEVKSGIFKRIVNLASVRTGNFENVIDDLKTATFEGRGTNLTIKAAATTFNLKYKGGTVFYIHPHNSVKSDTWYPVNIFNIQQYFEKETFEGSYNDTYVREIVSYLKREKGLKKTASVETIGEPYVLIIDEINRGNISQIFGELITLIEDGKRIGKTEELSVTLPYSREIFSVPPNFYILGTMNTADRSVEALDTALRRRFTFEFIPPESTLLKDKQITNESRSVNLKEILDTLNERIAYLLDDDHQIGHSYFLSVSTVEDLRIVFRKSIIPLLKEYFYNDFGKIRMVLGDGFVTKKTGTEAKPKFAVSDESFVMEKTVYSINEIKEDFDIVAALNKTLGNE